MERLPAQGKGRRILVEGPCHWPAYRGRAGTHHSQLRRDVDKVQPGRCMVSDMKPIPIWETGDESVPAAIVTNRGGRTLSRGDSLPSELAFQAVGGTGNGHLATLDGQK